METKEPRMANNNKEYIVYLYDLLFFFRITLSNRVSNRDRKKPRNQYRIEPKVLPAKEANKTLFYNIFYANLSKTRLVFLYV